MSYENYVQRGTIIGLEMHAIPHPTVVVCDFPGCKNQFPEGLGVKGDTNLARMAREAGWTGPMERGKEGDRCPEHSKPHQREGGPASPMSPSPNSGDGGPYPTPPDKP